MKYSANQLDWLYKKCLEFNKRWTLEISDKEFSWEQFCQEYKELYAKSRQSILMHDLLIATVNYVVALQSQDRPTLDALK